MATQISHRVAVIDDEKSIREMLQIGLVQQGFDVRTRPMLKRVYHLRVADLEIDLEARTARRGERWIDFSTREFDLLATLARRPNRVFTREELLDLVWGSDSDVAMATVEIALRT